MNYSYELALSRKLLKNVVSPDGKFTYSIILNAMAMDDLPGVTISRDASGTIKSISIDRTVLPPNPNQGISNNTDVSGEYTLN